MRNTLLVLAALASACNSSGGSEGAIMIDEATLGCGDDAKLDVAGSIAAACNGKLACTCDEQCWTNGQTKPGPCAGPTPNSEPILTVSYQAHGLSQSLTARTTKGARLVIPEKGAADLLE